MLIITRIAVWFKTIRCSTIFAYVHFITNFPIFNPGFFIYVMFNHTIYKFFPFFIIIWFYNILVNYRKENFWFKAETHERFRTCCQNVCYGTIQRLEMIFSPFWKYIIIFAYKKPDNGRM